MILRRAVAHVRDQDWTSIVVELVIVVLGVFLGLQANLWNEARVDAARREQIIDGLVTNLDDAVVVQDQFVAAIDSGLSGWQAAYERGERPAPFYFRIPGSDTGPDVWSMFEQMQLTDLFDPVTLFDLSFFYSELDGVGRKYIRYVTFVENEVLPGVIRGKDSFYDGDGRLRPEFQANMDRLRDYEHETRRMTAWARCLVYRLEADRTFEQTCLRAGFRLEGME